MEQTWLLEEVLRAVQMFKQVDGDSDGERTLADYRKRLAVKQTEDERRARPGREATWLTPVAGTGIQRPARRLRQRQMRSAPLFTAEWLAAIVHDLEAQLDRPRVEAALHVIRESALAATLKITLSKPKAYLSHELAPVIKHAEGLYDALGGATGFCAAVGDPVKLDAAQGCAEGPWIVDQAFQQEGFGPAFMEGIKRIAELAKSRVETWAPPPDAIDRVSFASSLWSLGAGAPGWPSIPSGDIRKAGELDAFQSLVSLALEALTGEPSANPRRTIQAYRDSLA